jgi:ankyrin repeat protein
MANVRGRAAAAALTCALALHAQKPAGAAEPWPKWPVFALVLVGDADGLRRHLAAHPADRDLRNSEQELPIHVAADNGKADCVAVLLAAGADATQPAYNQFTPLHLAAYRGHLEVVKLLVRQHVPLDPPSVDGTPLQAAAKRSWREIVLWLRNAGADYDLPTAAVLGDQEWVEKLLAARPDLRVSGDLCREVARRGRTEILRRLLDRREPDPSGPSPGPPLPGLCWYAIHHADTLAMLFEHGEDVQQRFHERGVAEGGTLLHVAASSNATATVDLLIGKGLAVDVTDADGRPPLLDAAEVGAAEGVAALLRHGAKAHRDAAAPANALDLAAAGIDRGGADAEVAARRRIVDLLLADGMPLPLLAAIVLGRADRVRELVQATPRLLDPPQGAALLGRAARMQHLDVVRVLLDAGVPVDAKDARGYTAMHWAAFWDVVAAIDLLHDRGAAVDPVADRGVTPLHEAARIGRVAAARRLLQLGADRTRRTADGETPASLAAQSDHAAEFRGLWMETR